MKKIFQTFVVGFLICGASESFAQQEKVKDDDLLNMSLADLMDIKIVSASKKTENLFDAPFSASVLTKEEIEKAGSTSIMEALRLIPGMIVREQTNGNFDIHLRGLDNVPRNSIFPQMVNTTTLVMINNRIVYNNNTGGTFWETLPIDLNDVEKIEVVRGPVAPMYGPNAVSGVINIITRKPVKKGLYAVANAQAGSHRTLINNASIGYLFNDKIHVIASGNYQRRDRSQMAYYEVFRNRMVENPDSLRDVNGALISNATGRFPNPELAMDRYGANVFLNYTPKEKRSFQLSAGLQNSTAQKVYTESRAEAPLSVLASDTRYVDVKATSYGLTMQASYVGGVQAAGLGVIGQKFDHGAVDASLEYDFKYKNISLKPGIAYRNVIFDDTPYWNIAEKEGLFNGRKQILNQAASLQSEYKMLADKLRLVAGVRVDQFNYPKQPYLSYQFAVNYKLAQKHLFRVVYSRASRSPFIVDTYLDYIVARIPSQPPREIRALGNQDLKLVTSDMAEVGYRGKLLENLQVDLEMFHTYTRNYVLGINHKSIIESQGGPPTLIIIPNIQINVPLEVKQYGVTGSANYVTGDFQFKPFVTFQQTQLYNGSKYTNTADASATPSNPKPDENNYLSGMGSKVRHQATPTVFGGAFINYQFRAKINFNLNPYYLSKQVFYHRDETSFNDDVRGIDHIQGKLLVNAKVSYSPIKQLSVYVSAKNMLNDKAREYYHTDDISRSYLGGIHFEF